MATSTVDSEPADSRSVDRSDAARERTSQRLLRSSATTTYDPVVDIDWDAPLEPDRYFVPPHRLSLYGTELWEHLTEEQRIELSKHEVASIASIGIWFEGILMQMLVRHTYDRDPTTAHVQYAYTEIGDECRHSTMFGKMIDRLGAPYYRPRAATHVLGRFFKTVSNGPMTFAGALFVEEMLDQLQREARDDESMQPLVRMVSHVHVVEEARHMRYAREEAAREWVDKGFVSRQWTKFMVGGVALFASSQLIHPRVYAAIGLDPKQAARVAAANPHWRRSRAWAARRVTATLKEYGMIGGLGRRFWKRAGLLDALEPGFDGSPT
jgi:P-aminobenzoate N-oxygenase AurF